MTSFIIMLEMRNSHPMLVPLMTTAVAASGVSKLICPARLYQTLAERFLPVLPKAGPEPARDDKKSTWRGIMEQAPIPDDVKRFILISVPSVPYLEAMLLLRNDAAQDWDAARLAQRLYMSEKAAAGLLTQLLASGMLAPVNPDCLLYRYRPQSEDLAQIIERLAITYSRHLVDVTNIIHSKTNKKAHQFADAFKWRKDS